MIPQEAIDELRKLNENLERLHADQKEFRPVITALVGELKTLKIQLKGVAGVGKQIHILNSILLQIGKAQGITAMFGKIIDGVTNFARRK